MTRVDYIKEPQCGKWVVYSVVDYANPNKWQQGKFKNYVATVYTETEAEMLIERLYSASTPRGCTPRI